MARQLQVSVEPRLDGRWAVQTDETQRADSLHDKKSEAVARGCELAANQGTECDEGRAREDASNDSHGNDACRVEANGLTT